MNRSARSNRRSVRSRPLLLWAGLAAAALLLFGAALALWQRPTRVVVIGDSHVKGTQSEPRGPSFVEVLQEELGLRYEVVAAGCAGSSTYDWTHDGRTFGCSFRNAYPMRASPQLPAKIVVILLGTNDALGFGERKPISPEVYAQAMQELVLRVQRDGGQRILLLGPPPNPLAWRPARRRLQAYSEALAALAELEPHVYMGPDLQEVIDLKEHFGGKDAHMNAAGHRLIGESLAPAVRAVSESGDPSAASEPR